MKQYKVLKWKYLPYSFKTYFRDRRLTYELYFKISDCFTKLYFKYSYNYIKLYVCHAMLQQHAKLTT